MFFFVLSFFFACFCVSITPITGVIDPQVQERPRLQASLRTLVDKLAGPPPIYLAKNSNAGHDDALHVVAYKAARFVLDHVSLRSV